MFKRCNYNVRLEIAQGYKYFANGLYSTYEATVLMVDPYHIYNCDEGQGFVCRNSIKIYRRLILFSGDEM